jgi:hypothetical protein
LYILLFKYWSKFMPTSISYFKFSSSRRGSGRSTGEISPEVIIVLAGIAALVGWGYLAYYSPMLALCNESDNSREKDCMRFSADESSIKIYMDRLSNAFPIKNEGEASSSRVWHDGKYIKVLHCPDETGVVLYDDSVAATARIEIGDVRPTAHVLSEHEIAKWSKKMPDTQGYPVVYIDKTNGKKSKICFFPDKDWGKPETMYSNSRNYTDFDACSDSSTCMAFSKEHWANVLSMHPLPFVAVTAGPFILFALCNYGPEILNRIHTGASRVGGCGKRALDSIGSACGWATSFCSAKEKARNDDYHAYGPDLEG